MANKTISLDPEKSKRARTALYANPNAMAQDSAVKNYKISERTIRSIEDGRTVKLSTAENYSTILGYSVEELAKNPSVEDERSLEIDISSTEIFGSCSESLLETWRSHYSHNEEPPWSDLDIVRGTEREMKAHVAISTLKPASLEQIIACAIDYKSPSKSFLQNKSASHGLGGRHNEVPYISHNLIWLLQSNIQPDDTIVSKLEQIQKGLHEANSIVSERIAHSAEFVIEQLKTSSKIRQLVTSLYNKNQLRFMYGELSSECVNTFTKKTLIEGNFEYNEIKRKVLLLCNNSVDSVQVKYSTWSIPKAAY